MCSNSGMAKKAVRSGLGCNELYTVEIGLNSSLE